MRVAFYAPLKPPDHPVPSGDRRVARQIMRALVLGDHDVELAARFRSYDGTGDAERQTRLAGIGGRLAARFVDRMHDRRFADRPQIWVTYHLYYKAPDWIGPRVAGKLGIPYVAIEASVAGKRAGGPWSLGHEATIAALARAAAVISLNPADEAGVAPHVASPSRLHRLKPFLDIGPYRVAAEDRARNRDAVARRFGLDPGRPWLLAVGMMRPGDKLDSYTVLGECLAALRHLPWMLLVVGDGPARNDVRAALAPLGDRVVYAGERDEADLPPIYAASDFYVWPAVTDACGMAIREAHAAGLPVVAGASGGVGEIVADGESGALVRPRDAAALAAVLEPLLRDPDGQQRLARAALKKTAAEHDLAGASRHLDAILSEALQIGARA